MSGLATLARTSREALQSLLQLLYPPKCPLCEAPIEGARFVCQGCLARIARVRPPWCVRCGEPQEGHDLCQRCAYQEVTFERARSYGFYEGDLAELIRILKFHGERALAWELAQLLAQLLEEGLFSEPIDGITFVPMSPESERLRGFNQAELLAECLGQLVKVPVFATLRKIRQTRPQVELSGKERIENVKGAFAPQGPTRCEKILLIDDVFTTGATATECSRTLKAAGYKRVYVLTLARTRLHT